MQGKSRTLLYLDDSQMAATGGYIPSLDGLRALSILLVLAAHIVSGRIFPGGLGVSIFFVISGYLITRLLFLEYKRRQHVDLRSFYIRRMLRLYPVAIVFTAVVVLTYLVMGLPIQWIEPVSALFYFSNYYYNSLEMAGVNGTMPFRIFWSLSIEEHFYIVFPSLFLLLRGNANGIAMAMVGLIAGTLALRIVAAMVHPEWIATRIFYFETQYRLDSIAWGVLVAALCEVENGRAFLRRFANVPVLFAATIVVLGCIVYRDPFFRETIRYSLTGAAIACSIVAVLFSPRLSRLQVFLNDPRMIWIGRLSYSLYIWHFIAPAIHEHFLGETPRIVTILSETAISSALAVLSYRFVEQPMLTLRHRFGSPARACDPVPGSSDR